MACVSWVPFCLVLWEGTPYIDRLMCVVDLGNILQIVSAPGQQIIRPQGSMVMQTMPQAVPASNASATPGTPHPALSAAQQGDSFTVKILHYYFWLTVFHQLFINIIQYQYIYIIMLKVNTFLWDRKCYHVPTIKLIFLYKRFNICNSTAFVNLWNSFFYWHCIFLFNH